MFSTRPIRLDDLTTVATLWLQCTQEVACNEAIYTPALNHTDLTHFLTEEFTQKQRFGWLALVQDQIVAYVTCQLQTESQLFVRRDYLYIHDLDVHPQFRRQGVSRLLMHCVEGYARLNGIKRLELGVAYNDPRSRRVWESYDFESHFIVLHKNID
jgi:GNAT superfamily N-acetyltransferase